MKIPVSDQLLKAILRHYSLLAQKGRFDRTDVKTANALRVSGKEIEKLQRIINRYENEFHDKCKKSDSDSHETE